MKKYIVKPQILLEKVYIKDVESTFLYQDDCIYDKEQQKELINTYGSEWIEMSTNADIYLNIDGEIKHFFAPSVLTDHHFDDKDSSNLDTDTEAIDELLTVLKDEGIELEDYDIVYLNSIEDIKRELAY